MTVASLPKAPKLSAIQIAWLQEIGIDKRMLASYAADHGPFPTSGGPVRSVQEGPGVSLKASASDAAMGGAGSGLQPVSALLESVRPEQGDAQAVSAKVSLSALLQKGSGVQPRVASTEAGGKNAQGDAAAASTELPNSLEALQAHVAVCQLCDLSAGRSQTVFGTGAVQAPAWLIVGEAPGELDDREGLPFQGRPGVLLQAMLASIGVRSESEVFFTNLVKCRPLSNRTPESPEIAACMPYLQRQIALLQPQRILALGKLAAQALLGVEAELEALRGQVHHVRGEGGQSIPLVATYHPASLLLRPQHKADAWVDLNLARSILVD
ncbi:uracil-DNA glycosylase [Alcaligenaceae bacterium]|nr:uracil-DNA glycosylase [Alcaligenaceae bacterium]